MTTKQQTALAAGALLVGAAILHTRRATRRVDFAGKSILITGGSRGLGLLVARELAAQGAIVTIAARDAAELDRARDDLVSRGGVIRTLVSDVALPSEAERLVREVVQSEGRLDVLINNAGVITVGPMDHMTPKDFEEAMAVHFWGPLHTMLAAIPLMRQQGGGRIVNVSSIGGKIGVPHLVPYCASKFALAGLSDSLRAELAKDDIRVTTAFPGLMRTGSPFNACFKGRHRDELTWFALADSMPGTTVDGERAAHALLEACRYGDPEVVIGWPAKIAVIAQALAPELVAHAMALADQLVLPSADDGDHRSQSGWQRLSGWVPSKLTRLTERAALENNEVPNEVG
jgi:NAD(P)-dependent dehydrogenase (short-subunit alcohol dehydrogenase family)